ncbi:DUF4652 domain-containing protein [Sporosarcina sp. Marseille-Q4063]|uniref:DUF4652 domain-containing protein n=1 Tax=Sporosarcina sp. Marseille-Q4063 TaxID=2810514 RepID=UPI001BAF5835|nr:DUF4652 domain-containing protein [Sporosarcina sp. Marseille-Q4063]QUW23372.1 DUF4652 domain-containing protein [Sporosarcina sp. Marseille-Q4063]
MKLEYDYDERVIYVKKSDEDMEIIENNSPSEPVISFDESKATYISPLEWESLGSLYLIDLDTLESEALIIPKDDTSVPKEVIWIDNENLAIIMGFGSGTISIGGNVFIYNISTDELNQLTHHDSKIQITNIKLKEPTTLQLKGIKYTDENFMYFEEYFEKVSITN